LRPLVYGQTKKYASKVKFGRGFSLAELREAKLTQSFARTVGIACDHRRHNTNAATQAENVKRLNDYKAKLVLFPLKDGAPKKGQINDATKDALKGAVQNTTEGVFALPTTSKRCKIEAITKEMKAQKTFRKLRTLRVNAKFNGKRIKAAKDAEAAKK